MWMTYAYIGLEIVFIMMLFTKQTTLVKSLNFILALVIAFTIYVRFKTGHLVHDLPNVYFMKGLSNLELAAWLGSALLLAIIAFNKMIKLRDKDF